MLVALIDQEYQRLQEYDFDWKIQSALRSLSEFGGSHNKLPLTTLQRCAEASSYNSAAQAVSQIAAYANEEALETLLQIHGRAGNWLLSSVVEQYIEELGGRLGIRITRTNGRLIRA